ncbi:cytoplasmic 60S subunit biogenesis factor ZNF622 [Anabrus simplex]|uniref:cytoplasmic 60S subunit biogenesis factor ZNF622 n=1 Tax=Anabrus simplex TaxID=316456 RepID=UPI0035A2ACA1
MEVHNRYTCITCNVAFKVAEVQRRHYQSDWHRYNLKRKVAELPPVSAEEFQRRVLLQREKDEAEKTPTSVHCSFCRKTFSSQNAYDNHLNSKRHKSFVSGNPNEDLDINKSSKSASELQTDSLSNIEEENKKNKMNGTVDSPDESNSVVKSDSADESEYEEVDSDEWEAELGDNPIANNDCLFCSHHSGSMLKNLKHMSVAHSFFIPDTEYVVDMKGLLMYLGEKISQYYMCLWCNDKGRTFYSIEAAQQHMMDKGHCKMLHEGEALAEYADYYDYSSSYPDQGDPDEEVALQVIDDSDYELVLPSGAKIGHRSLMRYYRQKLDPSRAVVPQKKIHRVLAQYRALGWTETEKEQAARKARDIHFMRRMQSRLSTKLSVKTNKLQKHFRPQVNF